MNFDLTKRRLELLQQSGAFSDPLQPYQNLLHSCKQFLDGHLTLNQFGSVVGQSRQPDGYYTTEQMQKAMNSLLGFRNQQSGGRGERKPVKDVKDWCTTMPSDSNAFMPPIHEPRTVEFHHGQGQALVGVPDDGVKFPIEPEDIRKSREVVEELLQKGLSNLTEDEEETLEQHSAVIEEYENIHYPMPMQPPVSETEHLLGTDANAQRLNDAVDRT